MAYNKDDVVNLGNAIYDLLDGFRNGVGVDDIANLTSALVAAPAATNELKEDFDAAGLHLLAVLADRFGDSRVNPPAPPV